MTLVKIVNNNYSTELLDITNSMPNTNIVDLYETGKKYMLQNTLNTQVLILF